MIILFFTERIEDFESAKHFFDPIGLNCNPFLTEDMSNAVERIKLAINKMKVMILEIMMLMERFSSTFDRIFKEEKVFI